MTSFQFDENFNDKKVIEQCNAEGQCSALRFPKKMVGRACKDPEVLATLMVGDNPIVTFDHEIVEEHGDFIPDNNPGLIIIRSRYSQRTMKSKVAVGILANLKLKYPNWNTELFCRLKIDICETRVSISTIKDHRNTTSVEFSDHNFRAKLSDLLERKRQEAIASRQLNCTPIQIIDEK